MHNLSGKQFSYSHYVKSLKTNVNKWSRFYIDFAQMYSKDLGNGRKCWQISNRAIFSKCRLSFLCFWRQQILASVIFYVLLNSNQKWKERCKVKFRGPERYKCIQNKIHQHRLTNWTFFSRSSKFLSYSNLARYFPLSKKTGRATFFQNSLHKRKHCCDIQTASTRL